MRVFYAVIKKVMFKIMKKNNFFKIKKNSMCLEMEATQHPGFHC